MNQYCESTDNALALMDILLELPPGAFRPPFQKWANQYQADLAQALKSYQRVCQMTLPTGLPASRTQWYRWHALVRKINGTIPLLTDEVLKELKQKLDVLSSK